MDAQPDRRGLLAAGGAMAASAAHAEDGAIAGRFASALAAGTLAGLHGLVVLRDGATVFERYLPGDDNARGRPLGRVAFGPETLHDLRSVSKSIVGLLYGIALAEGRVPPPEAGLLAQFPAYADLAADPRRARWTIAHALSMTLGTEWDESGPYIDARNSEIAMDQAADPLRFVLDRPILHPPGTHWTYNGGATALLGALITRGTGQPLQEFARMALLAPLGIEAMEWASAPDGTPYAASGMRLRPRDLARIGQTMLQGGVWQGRAVIPRDWLERRIEPVAVLEDGRRYAKQWYFGRFPHGAGFAPWVGAIGNGGQRLFILAELGLVVAVNAGIYNTPDQGRMSVVLMREVILPTLVPRDGAPAPR